VVYHGISCRRQLLCAFETFEHHIAALSEFLHDMLVLADLAQPALEGGCFA